MKVKWLDLSVVYFLELRLQINAVLHIHHILRLTGAFILTMLLWNMENLKVFQG